MVPEWIIKPNSEDLLFFGFKFVGKLCKMDGTLIFFFATGSSIYFPHFI